MLAKKRRREREGGGDSFKRTRVKKKKGEKRDKNTFLLRSPEKLSFSVLFPAGAAAAQPGCAREVSFSLRTGCARGPSGRAREAGRPSRSRPTRNCWRTCRSGHASRRLGSPIWQNLQGLVSATIHHNFGKLGPVFGYIETDFWKKIFTLQHSLRSAKQSS